MLPDLRAYLPPPPAMARVAFHRQAVMDSHGLVWFKWMTAARGASENFDEIRIEQSNIFWRQFVSFHGVELALCYFQNRVVKFTKVYSR
jgi:hypothetical protein